MMSESKGNQDLQFCPYCDTGEAAALCKDCRVALFFCPHCGALVARGEPACPSCQGEIGYQAGS